MSNLMVLEAAQARLLALAPAMGIENVPVDAALGRVLAQNLVAHRTQPPADLSAMDGYAIAGSGPWQVIGESRAGAPFEGALGPAQATRISTGAHMPEGSDRVLIKENAEVAGTTVSALDMPDPLQHVRRRGFDFASGDVVLGAGTVIGPAQIALALSSGHVVLPVSKRPRVAVLDTGDELAADPENCPPDRIPASNGAMLAAMLAPLVGEVRRIGPVGDDMQALAEALERAEDCDILVTSGGASVGDHDLVQSALIAWGAQIDFWKVAIKPGKPLMVARRANTVVLGLPGNPVSSFVTAFLFALPLIRKSMGMAKAACLPAYRKARLDGPLPPTGDRREFVRGWFGGHRVVPTDSQDSSALRSLAAANCLIERRENSPAAEEWDPVTVYPFHNG